MRLSAPFATVNEFLKLLQSPENQAQKWRRKLELDKNLRKRRSFPALDLYSEPFPFQKERQQSCLYRQHKKGETTTTTKNNQQQLTTNNWQPTSKNQ